MTQPTLHDYFNNTLSRRVRTLREPVLAFYINNTGNRLTNGDNREVRPGITHRMPKERTLVWDGAQMKYVPRDKLVNPRCCSRGMHASPTLMEATSYVSLPEVPLDHDESQDTATIWLVELSGKVHLQEGMTRKAAAEYRHYIEGRRVAHADVKRLIGQLNQLSLPSTKQRHLKRSSAGHPVYRTTNGVRKPVYELRQQPVFVTLRDVRNALSKWMSTSPPQRDLDRAKVDRVIRKWLATLPIVEAVHGTDSQAVA